MKQGYFPKFFIIVLCGVGVLWPTLGYPAAAYEDLKNRDLHYLEHLKKELEKAESMPGGLERAREIKRRIETIERGTDIQVPAIKSFPEQVDAPRAIPNPVEIREATMPAHMTLTESTAGNELDLFHDNTITVGEDYGVPRSVIEEERHKQQAATHLYKSLEIPDSGVLREPSTATPLYGTPMGSSSSLADTTTATPIPYSRPSPDAVPVDAPHFQTPPQALYGTPPGYKPISPMNPSAGMFAGRVVPTVYKPAQSVLPWKGDRSEVTYLEEKLRAKLAQLAHARKKLKDCTGQEADAWTSRIYDLETEKRSLLRMMKALGVTPEITTVSFEEDPEFDTIQSQEYQLIRQINAIEKQEKKVRRQMRFSKDPEVVTNAGDLLSRLEQNRKLLEASLKTLKLNTANVDPTSIVERPTIYTPIKEDLVIEEPTEMEAPKVIDLPKTEAPAPKVIPELLESREIDIMDDIDDDECPLTENTGFWTKNVPNSAKRPLPPVRTPSRPNKEDVRQLINTWKAG